jgi:hypothetical protein
MKKHWLATTGIVLMLSLAAVTALTYAQGPGPRGGRGPQEVLGTGFTYQGRLFDGDTPVENTCDFHFGLWDAAGGGAQLGITQTVSSQEVSDGCFTVVLNDAEQFGESPFTGDVRWLAVTVQCNGDSSTASLGRQELTAAPYALYALETSWDGMSGIPADFADEVDNDTTTFWSLTGDSGTTYGVNFLGTTDGVSLTLAVSGTAALRLEPNAASPNVIGGHVENSVADDVVGATIGGGGENGSGNRVTDEYGTVGGGSDNEAGNGDGDTTNTPYATVAGGWSNSAGNDYAAIGGGSDNSAVGVQSTVGGGSSNTAIGLRATVGGGGGNTANSNYSTVGGGGSNMTTGLYATVGGGYLNHADAPTATIAGGEHVNVTGAAATVAGGSWITVTGDYGTVGGGQNNVVTSTYGTVGGGLENEVTGFAATVGGGGFNAARHFFATVGGGAGNVASEETSTVSGGSGNSAFGIQSTVGGGHWNTALGHWSGIGGGDFNFASGDYATISGGTANTASEPRATVSGGWYNNADGNQATVSGGGHNTASGYAAAIPGGENNHAEGDYSFAAGRRAKANHDGAFVWADSTDLSYSSTITDQFAIRATNGVSLAINAGSSASIATGERFRDNGIIAWCRVPGNGLVGLASFGVESVARISAGTYAITITAQTAHPDGTTLIPMAVAEIDSPPSSASGVRIVSINQRRPRTFEVYINNGSFDLVDNDFVFMVTGR